MAVEHEFWNGGTRGHERRAPAFLWVVPPLAWALALNINYGLASHACFPRDEMRANFLTGWDHVWRYLAVVDIACLLVALACLGLAVQRWPALPSHENRPGMEATVIAPGDATTGSFAATSVLIGLLFTIAIFVNALSLGFLSTCSQA